MGEYFLPFTDHGIPYLDQMFLSTANTRHEKSRKLIYILFLLCFIVYPFHLSFASEIKKVEVLKGHYFRYRGKPLILIGDSGTQSIMQNRNIDYRKWIDDLHVRGIKAAMIWSWMAVPQKNDGSIVDYRYGYIVPDITPWIRSDKGIARDGKRLWNLKKFAPIYWERLKDFVSYAESKGIIVVITVFDGWPKKFWSHPFNDRNGGPVPGIISLNFLLKPVSYIQNLLKLDFLDVADGRDRFWTLYDYKNEFLNHPFDEKWPWELKNQYFQECFAEKLIETTCENSNVIYELVNEGSNKSDYDQHWINFFKKRCDSLIMVNDDFTPLDGRITKGVDVLSWHSNPKDNPYSINHRWISGFKETPAKPVINSETVPEYYDDSTSIEYFRKIIWSTAIAGGGIFVQDDTVFSFDPAAPQKPKGEILRDFIGYANKFFNDSDIDIMEMKPHNELVKSGKAFVLASLGREYVAYIPYGGTIDLDLIDVAGPLEVRWFNPSTGTFFKKFLIVGGNVISFAPPISDDSALWIKKITLKDRLVN